MYSFTIQLYTGGSRYKIGDVDVVYVIDFKNTTALDITSGMQLHVDTTFINEKAGASSIYFSVGEGVCCILL